MFERFSDRARRVVVLAQEESRMLNHSYIGSEHLLLGLLHEPEGLAAKALDLVGVSLEAARDEVRRIVGPGRHRHAGHLPFTPNVKKVFEHGLRESIELGHRHIGTEHLLLGLIRGGEGVGIQVLFDLGVTPMQVRERVLELVRDVATDEDAEATEVTVEIPGSSRDPAGVSASLRSALGWSLALSVDPVADPVCARCSAPLKEHARVAPLQVPVLEGEDVVDVHVLFCTRCGATLGTVPGGSVDTDDDREH